MRDDKIFMPEIKPGIEIKIIDSDKVVNWDNLCELTECGYIPTCSLCAFRNEYNFKKWQEQCKDKESK